MQRRFEMKELLLATIIALMAVSSGLYAQEKETAQIEPLPVGQTDEITLELVWEKEIPSLIKDDWPYPGDLVFLDEDGYNVFSSQCKDPEKALKDKRILMIHDGKIKWLEGDELKVVKDIQISEGSSPNSSKAVISKNGRNIAIIEGMERYKYEEIIENNVQNKNPGDFKNTHATIRLFNWKGEELASTQFPLWGYIDLYPLGNDQTVILNLESGEGRFHGVKILLNEGKNLVEVFSNEESSAFIDYSEDGRRLLLIIENQWMGVFNDLGKEECRYICPRPFRGGYLSPKGNYIIEHTAGEYLMIYDRKGKLIKEQQVPCRYVAFSPNEKYLCITPGPKRVYLLEAENGKIIWEYINSESRYRSAAVTPQGDYIFLSSTLFHPTNLTLQEMADKSLIVFNREGQILNKSIVSSVKTSEELEFYRWESIAPPIRVTPDGKFLLVRLPNRLLLYHIADSGGE